MSWSLPLRRWQLEAVRDWGSRQPLDFLACVTPGGGKTIFAGAVAVGALEGGFVDQLLVVVPTTLLRTQWAIDLKRDAGLELDPRYRTGERISSRCDGAIVTYAQIMENPQAFRRLVERRKTLVANDEGHHAGEQSSWGQGILQAEEPAKHRLHLSGTPWKTNESKVAFLNYDERGYVKADCYYSYREALKEGVVRPVVAYPQGAEVAWRTADGQNRRATFEDRELSKKHEAEQLRAVLMHEGWIAEVIVRSHAVLKTLRKHEPDAACLMVAMTAAHARFVANVVREVTGIEPAVVLSEDPSADEVLATFKRGSGPYLIAVRKVAEGVDIKRLRVLNYFTNALTALMWDQIRGRIVRVRNGHREPSYMFLPANPTLLGYCERMEKEIHGYADPLYEAPEGGGSGLETERQESAFEVHDAKHRDAEVILTSIRTVEPFAAAAPPAPNEQEREVVLVAHKRHALRSDVAKLAGAVAHRFNLNRQDVYAWWKFQTSLGVDQLSPEQLQGRVETMQEWLRNKKCPVTPARSRS